MQTLPDCMLWVISLALSVSTQGKVLYPNRLQQTEAITLSLFASSGKCGLASEISFNKRHSSLLYFVLFFSFNKHQLASSNPGEDVGWGKRRATEPFIRGISKHSAAEPGGSWKCLFWQLGQRWGKHCSRGKANCLSSSKFNSHKSFCPSASPR